MQNYLPHVVGQEDLGMVTQPARCAGDDDRAEQQYALDGRNPNSYSGIFWVLGRYDRAWGPERPIYGKIRYMTSENTARKVRVRNYLEKYAEEKS